ncbi:glycoside hydrolase family 10 protein [Streptomyces sclerotialus]|uniref:glycoside hydrolase family 10 protein n=1 Tax=Streptomyces sclerotialus TaxID=1957 RepID=UPI0004C8625E
MRRIGNITRRGFAVAALGVASSALWTPGAAASPRGGGGAAEGTAAAAGRRGPGGGNTHRPEFRGMWLATVANRDWPSKPGLTAAQQQAELLAYFDEAAAARLNAVLFQVRPTADALWPSPHEPWSQYLTGVQGRDPGWNPLEFAVREAHERGLELHAWFNPYRIANHADPGKLIPTHPARVHPDWVLSYGGKLYYNPGLPEVRAFVLDAIMDAVRRYPVDGVHFDDYFYPYPVAGQTLNDDAAYAEHGGGFPDRASWRRDNVDRLVRELGERVHATRRTARFGVSPFAVWRNKGTDPTGSDTQAGVQTYDDLYADTRKWVREGWLDYIVPQVYWNIGFAAADYAKLVPWWARTVDGTKVHLYIGEALYKAGDPAQPAAWQNPKELSRHLTFDERYKQVRGNVYFSAKEVATDRTGAMARVVADHYPTRVRPPR